jgi:Cu+-exporting ATPase
MGIKATLPHVRQQQILLGNRKLMFKFGIDIEHHVDRKMSTLESEGKTVMLLALEEEKEKEVAGLIAVADTLKESSPAAIVALKELGVETCGLVSYLCVFTSYGINRISSL